MVTTYFDSSVLVASYLAEPHSAAARRAVAAVPQVPYTPLHHLEVRDGVSVAWSASAPDRVGSRRPCCRRLEDDVAAGRLLQVPLDLYAMFARAEVLSERYARRCLARSLDVLHVAAALELGCTRFVTLDTRQARLAVACGLKVVDLTARGHPTPAEPSPVTPPDARETQRLTPRRRTAAARWR